MIQIENPKFRKIKNLTVSEDGEVTISLRHVYPDKNGDFPGKEAGEFVTSAEILTLWDNSDKVKKSLEAQKRHSNLTIPQLAAWKIKCQETKDAMRNSGKSENEIKKRTFYT